ncbi:MAG: single-stranded-DNA-specific exonuclease RecJ [Phycisphaerae bacterium]|nr:single-stranded-DNA-specific exonuclease RecJ [Phycisphaerae bacterium]NIW73320.1 single-stranded-DNA-specific exonuclease RecJ [candidate division KSB1 bacterium]NIS53901.1 single-stranded-DNA-specific exonuclease RecJ [Phycisphaerae bacterium]NIU11512.1 single-stranded-DNA-specific exonuclease RecJ [Phycisphaerae bacterium]NIU59297.1 single-stranded-DNA-specific exonuclease RecJ [Phycisphaerae bacterium]
MQVSARTQKTTNPAALQALRETKKARVGSPTKKWVIRPPDDRSVPLAKSLKVSPLLAQVLINRGITDVQAGGIFLRPKLTELIEPEKMPGIETAVRRLKQAIRDREKIYVYGDYDVDGITGVAILWQVLTLLGARVDYYIPHRIDEGYGLNAEAVRQLAKAGSQLLITVDCGITDFGSASLAEELGIELIITDHHQPEEKLPRAAAIVHPALEQAYPNQDSSGAMVAFKLAWAIANEFNVGTKLQPALREFMLNATSLAAMGTVADIVQLCGENRVLTSYGLKALPECGMPGIQALIETAGLTGQGLDSFDIGFRLAPMLNAAGRMGHARLAVELLTSDSELRSMKIAEYLKEQNKQRQQCERKIFRQACEMITRRGLNHPDRKSIVLASEDWHGGVLGIVASRIVDKFYRPTIMLCIENEIAQGSGRSIPGFCLLSAIRECSHHLKKFGGHKMAAGVTVEAANIEQFAADFEAHTKQNLCEDDVVDKLYIDALSPLREFRIAAVSELSLLGPFGAGNPRPIFATKGVRLASPPRKVGVRGDHLQLAITDNTASIRCIGFRFGKLEKKLLEHEFFNVAYQPQINTYNANTSVEFVLSDIQFE